MVQGVDVLVFNIQDVGARFYTYGSTMALCMQAAAAQGLESVLKIVGYTCLYGNTTQTSLPDRP